MTNPPAPQSAAAPARGPDAIAALLLSSLDELAAAGHVETACRLAGRACVALRRSDPAAARRFDVLLHRLSRRLAW